MSILLSEIEKMKTGYYIDPIYIKSAIEKGILEKSKILSGQIQVTVKCPFCSYGNIVGYYDVDYLDLKTYGYFKCHNGRCSKRIYLFNLWKQKI